MIAAATKIALLLPLSYRGDTADVDFSACKVVSFDSPS